MKKEPKLGWSGFYQANSRLYYIYFYKKAPARGFYKLIVYNVKERSWFVDEDMLVPLEVINVTTPELTEKHNILVDLFKSRIFSTL